MPRLLFVVVLTSFVAACANPINQRTAENYYVAGERALAAGNLPLAKQNFSRALVNAEIGHLGPAAEAQAASKLAQVLGNMCEYDDAEKTFLRALSAEEAAFGANSPRTFVTRVELAQFSFDVGRDDKAVVYFEKAFANGSSLLESRDPTSYAALLDDYAISLRRTGQLQAAADASAKASALRNSAKGPSLGAVKSDYVPYPKSCPNS
jgi:tetratricopeptide (TPR) repeat protein